MIRFLIKGLIRDRSRSLFPTLTVVIGVVLTVFMYCWMRGAEANMLQSNASFTTGHVKIMTQAYAAEEDQIPNDLALMGVDTLLQQLHNMFPEQIWKPRIRFGGLIDVPDDSGETRSQGPAMGLAVDLFGPDRQEYKILNLNQAVVRGHLPAHSGEIVFSDEFAQRLGVEIGEQVTLISSTMYGSMATANFTLVGTVRFGISFMDRGAMLADISDIQQALDMQDAASEIMGFFNDFIFDLKAAEMLTRQFNQKFKQDKNEFSPIMLSLRDQAGLAQLLDMYSYFSSVAIFLFITVMSIVLWNAGLMGSLRRYGEIGVRLAIGESKGHIYRAMLMEALAIGFFGSIIGTGIGLALSYYLQYTGINISSMMKDASMMMSDVMRARVTPASYFIGFIPGLCATFIGTSISGIGIYRRQTSQLAKELEA